MSRNIHEMSGYASNYDSQNVECQPLIPSSKSYQDHQQGSQREQLRTLVKFKSVACAVSSPGGLLGA